MILRLTDTVSVDPKRVASLVWDRGFSYTNLTIVMEDGSRHVIRHGEGYPPDCYDIERRIVAEAAK